MFDTKVERIRCDGRRAREGCAASRPIRFALAPTRTSAWLLSCWICTIAACRSEPPAAQFIPAESVAERALQSALAQWQAGRPVEKGPDGVGLLLVDARHRDGKTLESFRIVGPQPWDRGRRFVVELKLTNDEASQRERFVVIGINPLLVFRQEDFDMLANWMHPMEPPESQP